jgi:hypothetical protein
MDILNVNDREEKRIESFPYKGKSLDATFLCCIANVYEDE